MEERVKKIEWIWERKERQKRKRNVVVRLQKEGEGGEERKGKEWGEMAVVKYETEETGGDKEEKRIEKWNGMDRGFDMEREAIKVEVQEGGQS